MHNLKTMGHLLKRLHYLKMSNLRGICTVSSLFFSPSPKLFSMCKFLANYFVNFSAMQLS